MFNFSGNRERYRRDATVKSNEISDLRRVDRRNPSLPLRVLLGPRDLEGNDQTARHTIGEFEAMLRAIESLEASAGVRQAHFLSRLGSETLFQLHAGPIVLDLNAQISVPRPSYYLNSSTTTVGYCMTHCILHDGLENQVGNTDIQHLRVNVDFCRQSIFKADTFNFEVAIEKVHLLF